MNSNTCPFVATENALLAAIAVAINQATPEKLISLAYAFGELSRARAERIHAERLLLIPQGSKAPASPESDEASSVLATLPGVRIYGGGKLVAEFGCVPSVGPIDPPDARTPMVKWPSEVRAENVAKADAPQPGTTT